MEVLMKNKMTSSKLVWCLGYLKYINGQKSCPVRKILNISFFVRSIKINQVSMERIIQDTLNDKILKEFGSVPSMQNLYKVGHYKLRSYIMLIRQNQ